jgi:hypothetical protein
MKNKSKTEGNMEVKLELQKMNNTSENGQS